MTSFATSNAPQQQITDLYKRVRYSVGLVLGVDEFLQQDAYFIERDRLHSRILHGYGTVSGLDVTATDTESEIELRVQPGVAVNPIGQEIRVPYEQCAKLDQWLANNETEVREQLPTPLTGADPLDLYVVLCYRECETDKVPIPGSPCRTQEDSMTNSRIAASYELKLMFEPPTQLEEDAVAALGTILDHLRISTESPAVTEDALYDLIMGLKPVEGQIPAPDLDADELLYLPPDDADDLIGYIVGVWITEVRPHLLYNGSSTANGPAAESCVLLAKVSFDVDGNLKVVRPDEESEDEAVTIDESTRPLLLSTRVLQEWMTGLQGGMGGEAGGDLDGLYPDPMVVGLRGRPIKDLSDLDYDYVLRWNDSPADRGWEVVSRLNGAVRINSPAGNDLDGTYPNPTVVGLRDRPISKDELNPGDVYQWNGEAWVPVPRLEEALYDGSPAGNDLDGTYPNPTVVGLRNNPISDEELKHDNVLHWDEERGEWTPIDRLDGAGGGGGTSGPAGNDLDGTYPNPTVVGLRDRPISEDEPNIGDVYQWNGDEWVPVPRLEEALSDGSPAGNDLEGTYPNPTVVGLRNNPISDEELKHDNVLHWDEERGEWTPIDRLDGAGSGGTSGPAGGDLFGSYPNPAVIGLRNNPISDTPLADDDVLHWDAERGEWTPISRLDGASGGGGTSGTAGGDLFGTYPNPAVIGLRSNPIRDEPVTNGDVYEWDGNEWVPVFRLQGAMRTGSAAGGDLDGNYPNPIVVGLQGRPVQEADLINDNDVLAWDSEAEAWRPRPAAALPLILPFATIIPGGNVDAPDYYKVWFNLDGPENRLSISELVANEGLIVQRENETGPSFLTTISNIDIVQFRRNVFFVAPAQNSEYLRFVFDLNLIQAELVVGSRTEKGSLASFASQLNIGYEGQEPEQQVVVKYVRGPLKLD